jgi:ABC-2 type transport system ATP-binding protein
MAVPSLQPVGIIDDFAVEAWDLSKRHGTLDAVDSVDFTVKRGAVFVFLGPDSAGEAATIEMLCTLARPTGGSAAVTGLDVAAHPNAVRRGIGLVFQGRTLDRQLTAEENLRFHAVLYGCPETRWLCRRRPAPGRVCRPEHAGRSKGQVPDRR